MNPWILFKKWNKKGQTRLVLFRKFSKLKQPITPKNMWSSLKIKRKGWLRNTFTPRLNRKMKSYNKFMVLNTWNQIFDFRKWFLKSLNWTQIKIALPKTKPKYNRKIAHLMNKMKSNQTLIYWDHLRKDKQVAISTIKIASISLKAVLNKKITKKIQVIN